MKRTLKTVVITGSDDIMMKSWLFNLFGGKIRREVFDVAVVVGTSAVNCGISSSSLYYIFCKGFPRTFIEFVLVLGRLKRTPIRLMQDRIHILLSISSFTTSYFMILNEENVEERYRQLHEFRSVTEMLLSRDICVREAIQQYYGPGINDDILSCDTMCPSCCGESFKVVN